MSEKRPITPAGYDRLEQELHDLWKVERPRIVQEVADAAALGDRSENAEYKYGKRRLREIDRRVRYLSKLLEGFQIVDPSTIKSDVVGFGATVEIEDEDGVRKSYQLVAEEETAVKQGKISMKSPVGKALLKKKVGDVVVIKRPAGEIEVEVVSVTYV
jgi:transcription elongation factor GreB